MSPCLSIVSFSSKRDKVKSERINLAEDGIYPELCIGHFEKGSSKHIDQSSKDSLTAIEAFQRNFPIGFIQKAPSDQLHLHRSWVSPIWKKRDHESKQTQQKIICSDIDLYHDDREHTALILGKVLHDRKARKGGIYGALSLAHSIFFLEDLERTQVKGCQYVA